MATSSITDRFVLDDKGVDRLIEIIENSKAHPDKKIYESHKYEEGKKLLKQYFSGATKKIEKNTDTEIKMGDYEKWFEMDVGIQLANVGGEFCRAIRWKNRGDEKKEADFYNKAMDFLELTMQDPKNSHRLGELREARYELEDFFYGGNTYDNTDESIMKYYDSFLRPPYARRRKV